MYSEETDHYSSHLYATFSKVPNLNISRISSLFDSIAALALHLLSPCSLCFDRPMLHLFSGINRMLMTLLSVSRSLTAKLKSHRIYGNLLYWIEALLCGRS